jgi:excisionase family DNA binding protein
MALRSIKQAADTWGVSVYTARRLAAAGLVRTVNVGRRRLVPETEIRRVVATGVPNAAPGETKKRQRGQG